MLKNKHDVRDGDGDVNIFSNMGPQVFFYNQLYLKMQKNMKLMILNIEMKIKQMKQIETF